SRAVRSLQFSPDGKQLISGGLDGTIRLSDLATGEQTQPFAGQLSRGLQLVASLDGKTVATQEVDRGLRLRLRSLMNDEEMTELAAGKFGWIEFSSDGSTLWTMGREALIQWDTSTRREIRRFADCQEVF